MDLRRRLPGDRTPVAQHRPAAPSAGPPAHGRCSGRWLPPTKPWSTATSTASSSPRLARLGDTDAEVLRLVAWEQLSIVDVAAVLGIEPDAARQRLHRARRNLAREYDRLQSRPPHPRCSDRRCPVITEDEVMRLLERADPVRDAPRRSRRRCRRLPRRPAHEEHHRDTHRHRIGPTRPTTVAAGRSSPRAAAAVVAVVVGGLVLAAEGDSETSIPVAPPDRRPVDDRRRPRGVPAEQIARDSSTLTPPSTPIGR